MFQGVEANICLDFGHFCAKCCSCITAHAPHQIRLWQYDNMTICRLKTNYWYCSHFFPIFLLTWCWGKQYLIHEDYIIYCIINHTSFHVYRCPPAGLLQPAVTRSLIDVTFILLCVMTYIILQKCRKIRLWGWGGAALIGGTQASGHCGGGGAGLGCWGRVRSSDVT